MTYTPITCTKAATVNLRACLGAPFIERPVYPLTSPNYHSVLRDIGTGAFLNYASYIDNGTDQCFFSDFTDPDDGNFGGFYTGSKFMAVTQIGTDYHVGYVSQAYSDADDTTAPALTTANIGHAVTAIGTVRYSPCGRSEAGGDQISWLEGQTGEVHFMTATTSGLTRQQAFELDAGEDYIGLLLQTNGWIYDGTDFWMMAAAGSSGSHKQFGPFTQLVIRFKPTELGDPFDYDKFSVTFDDSTINDQFVTYQMTAAAGGGSHMAGLYAGYDYDTQTPFGRTRYFEISKDGTSYTEYVVSGNQAVIDFAFNNVPTVTKRHDGSIRLVGWAFSSGSGGLTPGTYDLTCTGTTNQGHVHAKKRTLGPPIITTGNLIPSGDMNAGSDVFKASGDMSPGDMLWKETK